MSNRVELQWHAVPPTVSDQDQARERMRWMALRMTVATGLLSVLTIWLFRQLQHLDLFPSSRWTPVLLLVLFNCLPTLLLYEALFSRTRTRGARYELREKSLMRNTDLVLTWSAYKAFRVIDAQEGRKEIEFIGRDQYSRTIPMPADVPEETVLLAIAKHLERYSLGKHGVVERQYPIPPLAVSMLVAVFGLIFACFFVFGTDVRTFVSVPRGDRGAWFVLACVAIGPLAFLIWYPMARFLLDGIRRQQLVLILLVCSWCGPALSLPALLWPTAREAFKVLAQMPEQERQAMLKR